MLVISTAGMFSPLFFATFGVTSGLYNISNGVQGIQDVYYGLSGDAYTESWNPGDALFESVGLPPKSYHVFGMVTTGVYTIAVPVKQYCTAGTSANMLMTKQQAFGNVLVDAGVDYGTTYICEQCGVDELTTMLMGVSMGTLAGFGGSVRDVDLPYLKSNKPSGNVANLVDDGYNGGNLSAAKIGNVNQTEKRFTRDDIINSLDGVTEKSTEIANAIRNKDIGINVLGDELFESYLGCTSDTVAMQVGDQIYVRSSSASLMSDVVHEGVHAMDYLNGVDENIISSWAGETTAYGAERLFQIESGMFVQFINEDDMMVHIWSNYSK